MRRTCPSLKIMATFGGEPYRRSALRKPIIIRKKKYTGIERRDRPAADSGSHGLNKYGQ
jgi:hypothetical protein